MNAMSHSNSISDEEFVSFLHNLGVDSYNKSYEWMLNDPDFSDCLRWIYESFDQNNALTAREQYRYKELEKHKIVPIELESKLVSLQDEMVGLCLPGEQDKLEELKLDIVMQKEKLAMLEKHEEILKELLLQNEKIKGKLTMEITQLNASQQQAAEDEKAAGDECLRLAKEIESKTNDVVHIISEALNIYGQCSVDEELAKRFFTYGPFNSYGQSQELFKSHFDLYKTKKFDLSKNGSANDEELQTVLVEARKVEDRLSSAVYAYIESKADLCGVRAKQFLISSFNNEIPTQIISCNIEALNNANQLLEQEESILDQQIQNAIKNFVERRTRLVEENHNISVLAVKEQNYKDLTFLHNVTQQAVALDQLLYSALRTELQSAGELLTFAAEFRVYLLKEAEVVSERIKSMNDICEEQEIAEQNLQFSNVLLKTLSSILGAEPCNDALVPINHCKGKLNYIHELKDNIKEGYKMKEAAVMEIKNLSAPLQKHIWDGCTKKPNCYNPTVSSLIYNFTHEMTNVDAKVVKISEAFNAVKNGDKHHLRKLWQWFLADPSKLPQ